MDKYKDMAQQAQGMMQSSAGMDDAGELMKMQEKYNRLAQNGIERKGKILSRRETGRADVGGTPEYEFKVEIAPDGGDAYEATVLQFVHAQNIEHFPEGKELTVKVDPENPQDAVLWG